jgi:hypothetical protein
MTVMFANSAMASPPSGSITGMRTLANGSADPFNSGSLCLYHQLGPDSWESLGPVIQYNFDGTYEISGLAAGTYRIGLYPANNGPVGYPAAFYGGGVTFETGTNVTVNAGSTTTNIDIQRGAAETLTVDAAEPDNRAKDAETLTAASGWLQRTLCEKPDVDWYKVDVVAGHTYTFETSSSPLFPVWSSSDYVLSDTFMTLLDSDAKTPLAFDDDSSSRYAVVRWIAPSTKTVYVRVTSAGEGNGGNPNYAAYQMRLTDEGIAGSSGVLAGSVLDVSNGNAPVPGTFVRAQNASTGQLYCTASNASGAYAFPGLPQGYYYLRAMRVGYDVTETALAVEVSVGDTNTIDLSVNRPMIPGIGAVSGTVHLSDGSPSDPTTVTLSGGSATFTPQTQTTAPNGTFYFGDLPFGTYTLTFHKDGYADIVERDFAVVSNNGYFESTSFIETLVPAGGIAGRVLDGSVPLAGVHVSVADGESVVTGADGTYALSGIEVGTAQVSFSKPGYITATGPVSVSAGATTNVEVHLARAKTSCTVSRTPSSASLTYKRKKGVAKITLKATAQGPYWAFGGARLILQSSKNGKGGWKTVSTLKTSESGVVSKTLSIKKASTVYYRWYAPDSTAHFAAYSTKFKVRVK